MVNINIDPTDYQFTTRNILNNFNIKEQIIPIKSIDLKFNFVEEDAYLSIDDLKYEFESTGGLIHFFQKLSINSTLISSLTNETLEAVVNERLKNVPTNFNLIIDQNNGKIITVTSMVSGLVSWKKIVQVVHDFFSGVEEKQLFLTTFTGLGISVKLNSDENSDLDVIRIEPQTPSSIPVYRGISMKSVPTKGYDEEEVLKNLASTLESVLQIDEIINKNYSIVK